MMRILTLTLLGLWLNGPLIAQVTADTANLRTIAAEQKAKSERQDRRVRDYAATYLLPLREELSDKAIELITIDTLGHPQFLVTSNAISAETISTDEVYTGGDAGLDLDGSDITLYIWDAGTVRETHQEFGERVVSGDGGATHWHSTHVGGTLVAAGVEPAAKGMAFNASLISFNWNNFNGEMADEAAEGAIISNHSYGWLRGWEGETWWGDPDISDEEDYLFGFYDESAQTWDEIAYFAPYFLIVKSAGNDRNNCGDGSYPCDGPYDCLDQLAVAKNTLVVAAVADIPGGYTNPSDVVMSGFSSWGPADDGRIKPDISANGTGLYSTDSDADDDYRTVSGTSMSAPSVAGSAALLQQHYQTLNGEGNFMRSATVRALVIHTADEAGSGPGPDYSFGWGLMNTVKAAEKITENDTLQVIFEETLDEGDSFTYSFTTAETGFIKATLAWTDPPGTPPAEPVLDPDDRMLVNDLDLKIEMEGADTTWFPWKLDRDNPEEPPTQDSRNDVDNVEQVLIQEADSGATFLVTVTHDGDLSYDMQEFSLVVSFPAGVPDTTSAPEVDFTGDPAIVVAGDSVQFTDLSTNDPEQWEWSFEPNTVTFLDDTDSTYQNPLVAFNTAGTYNVTLTCSNEGGSTSLTKLDYITVYDLLSLQASTDPDTLCAGDTTDLSMDVAGGTGDYIYTWTSEPPGFSSSWMNAQDTPAEDIIYIAGVSDGMQTVTDSVSLSVNPLPYIELIDWPTHLCNEDEPPWQLTSLPEGGIYQGEIVSPEGLVTTEGASPGWHTISYYLSDSLGCANSATDSIYVDDCVGLESPGANPDGLLAFPNPGYGSITLRYEEKMQEVEVIDTYGKCILRSYPASGECRINIPVSGLFLVRVTAGNGDNRYRVTTRVVVF